MASRVSSPVLWIEDLHRHGRAQSRGDVIGLLHSDDVFAADDVIARVAKALADADGVYGDLVYVSAARPARVIRYWRAGPYQRTRLAWGWMPPHPTLYLKRHVFERWGAYDSDFHITADYEAMLRWLVRGRICLAYLPRPVVDYRQRLTEGFPIDDPVQFDQRIALIEPGIAFI